MALNLVRLRDSLCSQAKPYGYCTEGTTCINGACVEAGKGIPNLTGLMSSIMTAMMLNKEVNFPDANLKEAVRDAALNAIDLNSKLDMDAKNSLKLKLADGTITIAHCLLIKKLDAQEKNIQNLEGVQYLTNLQWLHLWDNQISDISTLKNLDGITYLYLSNNPLSSISPLLDMAGLKEVWLFGINTSNNLEAQSVIDTLISNGVTVHQ